VDPHGTLSVIDTGAQRYAVQSFLLRYPGKTRELYTIHLRQWFEWCLSNGHDPWTIKRGHIEAWSTHLMEDRGLKVASVATKLNAVCGMYKFAFIDGLLAVNPAAYVRRPRVQFITSSNALSRGEAADVLKAAEDESPTTYALMCLLLLSGLRIGEAIATNVEHLGYERGYRTLFLPHRKGGKVGLLALPVRSAWAIDRMLAGRGSGPLLLGRDGGRISAGAIRRTVNRLCRQIGVTRRITPHSMRHTMVTLARNAGVSDRDLMASTGHSTAVMLAYYDHDAGAVERNAGHAVAALIGTAA
jgi:integrase/recombinase XerD